ncbi:hypothetical protein R1sor_014304 [Riccia sorocarpa]|uniref:Uncharacterized protein n=1 Tax=Riccia sorocarpa TaxID=122646 RepID=A0ABD3HCT4_9MARC
MGEAIDRVSSEKYLQQKKREEELADNPYHVLAGAFEVEMTEVVAVPEENVDAASIGILPPSPCKPSNVNPEGKKNLDQLGKKEAPETEPSPTTEERTDVENLSLDQLMVALQRSKEKTLQELKKSGTRSGKDEMRELHISKDRDHDQDSIKKAEETRKPPPFTSGVRWSEVESGSHDEVERLSEGAAEAENVREAGTENDVEVRNRTSTADTGRSERRHWRESPSQREDVVSEWPGDRRRT